jgi:hypothetical protein
MSQVWLRKYHRKWYKSYNYILGGALDGGAQLMIFILSFAVFGAAGVQRPFPHVRFNIESQGAFTSYLTIIFLVGWKSREGQC